MDSLAIALVIIVIVVAMVVLVILDNKKRISESVETKQENICHVYDNAPLVRCSICGGQPVITEKVNHTLKGYDFKFNVRCKDCGLTLFEDEGGPDLGYVLNSWNQFQQSDKENKYALKV